MSDCLIIGFNEGDFAGFVDRVSLMGERSPGYRDLGLSVVWEGDRPHRAMDLVNLARPDGRRYSNVDFLWPVILHLGSYLHARGFTFDYVNLFQAEKELLAQKLRDDPPLTVAITTTLYVDMEPIVEIVEAVRRLCPTARILVGGPYVYNQSLLLDTPNLTALFEYIGADVYVIGQEGENTLAAIVGALKSKRSLAMIPNLAYRTAKGFQRTPAEAQSSSLVQDRVDYSLFPAEAFGEFVSLRTAKSCPFACSFCGYPARGGAYTYLKVEEVERELDAVRRIGTVTTVTFLDDTFNVPKSRFKEILRMMIRRGYGFRWNSYLRADHADDECIDLMAKSGCEGVMLGVESGSDLILSAMNKTSRRADYLRVIPKLRDAGIVVHCNLIVGFPGETSDTVDETMSLVELGRPQFFRAQLWYADPTTPIWKRKEELAIRGGSFNWSHATMVADEAADHVERVFRNVEASCWLPQWGFEQWSLFYLQRRGISLESIGMFVRGFNGAIDARLASGERETSRARIDQIAAGIVS